MYVKENATPTNPRFRGLAEKVVAGTVGINPGGHVAAKAKAIKEGTRLLSRYYESRCKSQRTQ